MTRTPVTSSNLKSIGWDNGTLEVEFNDGSIYHYVNVPASKHASLMAEDTRAGGSVGSHFHRNIRSQHGYRKVTK
jgi:KTSC domain